MTTLAAPIVTPIITDRSPSGIAAAWRGWQYEMARAYDGAMPGWYRDLGARRRVFDAAARQRTVADVEAELLREHGACRHYEAQIRDRLAIRRGCQARFGVTDMRARTHSYSIRSYLRQLREARFDVARLNAEVTAIEED